MCKIYNNAQKQLKTKQRAKFRLDMFDHLLDTVISTIDAAKVFTSPWPSLIPSIDTPLERQLKG